MYEEFYGLKAEPFRLSPDHRFCFNHQSYKKAKAYMQYAFRRAEGFVMITGRPGTGKTTLVNDLVNSLSSTKAKVAMLVCTQLEADDLLRMVTDTFGISTATNHKSLILQRLGKFLTNCYSTGIRPLLIIDEAQDLSASALEELRLLTNLQVNSQPLLQIFLLGQDELQNVIHRPEMEQVHQRIVAACRLQELKEDESKAYIKHRLNQAGWRGDPAISEAVFPVIHKFSNGIPRRINMICSRLFLHGCVEELHHIGINDAKIVLIEIKQEQLTSETIPSDIDFDVPDLYEAPDLAPVENISGIKKKQFGLNRQGNHTTNETLSSREERLRTSSSTKAAFIPQDSSLKTGEFLRGNMNATANANRPYKGLDTRRHTRRQGRDRREQVRFDSHKGDRRKNSGLRKEDIVSDALSKRS